MSICKTCGGRGENEELDQYVGEYPVYHRVPCRSCRGSSIPKRCDPIKPGGRAAILAAIEAVALKYEVDEHETHLGAG